MGSFLCLNIIAKELGKRRETSKKVAESNFASSFLGRFPLEIRRLIYEYVLGGRKAICFFMTTGGILKRAVPRFSSALDRNPSKNHRVHPELLRACRQTYNEALGIMNSQIILAFKEGLGCLCPADIGVPLQRIAVVKHLRIHWVFGPYLNGYALENIHTWKLFWEVIVPEMSLDTVELLLNIHEQPSGWSYWNPPLKSTSLICNAPWLKPLHNVKGLKSMDLDISWHGSHEDERRREIAQLQIDLREIMTAEK